MRDERYDKKDEKHVEDDLRNASRGDGDAAEAENPGDNCDHKKGKSPAKHAFLPDE